MRILCDARLQGALAKPALSDAVAEGLRRPRDHPAASVASAPARWSPAAGAAPAASDLLYRWRIDSVPAHCSWEAPHGEAYATSVVGLRHSQGDDLGCQLPRALLQGFLHVLQLRWAATCHPVPQCADVVRERFLFQQYV